MESRGLHCPPPPAARVLYSHRTSFCPSASSAQACTGCERGSPVPWNGAPSPFFRPPSFPSPFFLLPSPSYRSPLLAAHGYPPLPIHHLGERAAHRQLAAQLRLRLLRSRLRLRSRSPTRRAALGQLLQTGQHNRRSRLRLRSQLRLRSRLRLRLRSRTWRARRRCRGGSCACARSSARPGAPGPC